VKTGANIDAERGVLSALLQKADPLPALQQLTAKDFFHHLYRRFYAHFKNTIEKGEPLIFTVIADEMKLDAADTAELAGLLDPMLVVRNLGELAGYVRIVKRDARLRELRAAADDVVRANGDATGLILDLRAKTEKYLESLSGDRRGAVVDELEDFLESDFPDAEPLVRLEGSDVPVFTSSSINQFFAWRGTGKTMLALALGVHMGLGTDFLRWRPTRRVKVLYVEGESRNSQLQQRLRALVGSGKIEPGYFRLLTYSSQVNGIPALSTPDGRQAIEAEIGDAEVIFLDSVSTLGRFPTNEEENWIDFLQWLNHLRQRGLCVIFLHHAGKSGMQRGHSRSEDMLDVSIKLTREGDEECDWLKCKLEYDKFRDNPKGIRSLVVEFREGQWFFQALEVEKLKALEQYLAEHPRASSRTIAHDLPELGSHTAVQRLRRKLKDPQEELEQA